MKFHTRFDPPKTEGFSSKFPPRVFQHFKDECDINTIVKRYVNGGVMPFEDRKDKMSYGDFSDPAYSDLSEALQRVNSAFDMFSDLPSDIRLRFHNDPVELVNFVHDNNNYDEAVKLGLVNKKVDDLSVQNNQKSEENVS